MSGLFIPRGVRVHSDIHASLAIPIQMGGSVRQSGQCSGGLVTKQMITMLSETGFIISMDDVQGNDVARHMNPVKMLSGDWRYDGYSAGTDIMDIMDIVLRIIDDCRLPRPLLSSEAFIPGQSACALDRGPDDDDEWGAEYVDSVIL